MRIKLIGAAAAVALIGASGLAAAQTVKIGYMNTMTGGLGIFGKHGKDGWDLALDHLGGKLGGLEVEMVYGDDQVKPDVGRQVVDKFLKKDRVEIIAGITWSNVRAAVQRPVTRAKKILISTNAGWSGMAGKDCSAYFFSTSWNNDQVPEAMGQLMNQENLSNVFLISANYQAGKDMLTGFERFYKGKVAGRILYRLGQTDFQAEISQIRAIKPAALFGFIPGPMGVAFMKQYRAAGLHETIPFYSVFTINHLSLAGHGANAIGTYTTAYWDLSSKRPDNVRFINDFKKKYGYHPSIFAAQAYDAPFLIDAGIKAAGGDVSNKKAMIEGMAKVTYLPTKGKFRYNVNHIPIQNFYKREVVADASGNPEIVTRSVVLHDHKDAYYKQCSAKKMKP
jgi:branched-chain amino acid transport system substrate-binding protein